MLTLLDFQDTLANELIIAHKRQNGFPMLGRLRFRVCVVVCKNVKCV
jgi:hypothetical protein